MTYVAKPAFDAIPNCVETIFVHKKSPFTRLLHGVKRKIGNFSLHPMQQTGSNPLGVRRGAV